MLAHKSLIAGQPHIEVVPSVLAHKSLIEVGQPHIVVKPSVLAHTSQAQALESVVAELLA